MRRPTRVTTLGLKMHEMLDSIGEISGLTKEAKEDYHNKIKSLVSDKSTLVCYGCGNQGHFRSECKSGGGIWTDPRRLIQQHKQHRL